MVRRSKRTTSKEQVAQADLIVWSAEIRHLGADLGRENMRAKLGPEWSDFRLEMVIMS